MKPRLLATSVHETGHAVFAILNGFTPLYVTNIPDATSLGRMYWGSGQRAVFSIVRGIVTSAERALALVYVAGVAAVRVVLETSADLAAADDECARAYARTTAAGEEVGLHELLADAEEVFAHEHVRNVTLALAHRLVRDRVVPGSDIEALIEAVGLRRGEETILRAASMSGPRGGREDVAAVLGDASFTDHRTSRYFFIGRRHSRTDSLQGFVDRVAD